MEKTSDASGDDTTWFIEDSHHLTKIFAFAEAYGALVSKWLIQFLSAVKRSGLPVLQANEWASCSGVISARIGVERRFHMVAQLPHSAHVRHDNALAIMNGRSENLDIDFPAVRSEEYPLQVVRLACPK